MAKPVAEITEDVKTYGRKAIFLGCGAKVNHDVIVDILGDKALFAPEYLNYQSAANASVMAEKKFISGETVSPDKLLPYYFRDTSAKKKFIK
jgi:tRNA threonylcarbamoyladenosine biosynthesis protein TsaB